MDIRDYLKRINYQGSLEPTLQTLQALHKAHLLAIPFENLSIHYGQPIILQQAPIQGEQSLGRKRLAGSRHSRHR